MDNTKQQIADLTATVTKLQSDFNSLSQAYYKNNFSGSQVFTKDVTFNKRLRVPHYSGAPVVGEIGDLIEVAGVLYICTTAGNYSSPATFTVVGTQS